MKSPAIVSYPSKGGSLDWKYETVRVREALKPDEVLVEMSAVGLCHTDVVFSLFEKESTRIFGHEGAGYVKRTGSNVTNCSIGDPVLLSYDYCRTCHNCEKGLIAYCEKCAALNYLHCENVGETFETSEGIGAKGKFFGQSSFSKLTVVSSLLVVSVKKFNLTRSQLDQLGPLGCGLQTGAGAVINAGKATKDDSVVIYGMGGVGIAAVMAAKIVGCKRIIAVDVLDSKLEIAKSVGATHGVLATNADEARKEILTLTNGGADLSIECVGGPKFVRTAIENAAFKGRIVYVGTTLPDDQLEFASFEFMVMGKQLIGCIEGDSKSWEFIPRLVQWYLDGQFPVEVIESEYPISDFQTALKDVKEGKTIKAILKFD